MGKVQILAVLTLDGCHSSGLYCKAYKELRLDKCGINEIRENALYHITPDYSISMLDEWRKDGTDIRYLAEATPDNTDYINGLLRMRVVDEIILHRTLSLSNETALLPVRPARNTLDALLSKKLSRWRVPQHLHARGNHKMTECSRHHTFRFHLIRQCSDNKHFEKGAIRA